MRRSLLAAITTATLVLFSRHAHANDPATAQALFDQAQKLMADDRWAEACPKLEESQRLDPGGGTLLHLAACREHEGKTATAWAIYQDALAAAKRDGRKDRAKIAQSRIDALGPRLYKLRVQVPAKDSALPGFRILRDNTRVRPALWGDLFPIDPGRHTISVGADGYKSWFVTVDVPTTAGEMNVDVPELEAEPAPTSPEEPLASTRVKPPPTVAEKTRGDTQRTVGIALGGVGVIGLVAGSIFGVLAFTKEGDADKQCREPDHTRCTAEGIATGSDSKMFGNVSTIAFIGGGVLAAGGAALYFTAPKHAVSATIAPQIGPGIAGLSFAGRF